MLVYENFAQIDSRLTEADYGSPQSLGYQSYSSTPTAGTEPATSDTVMTASSSATVVNPGDHGAWQWHDDMQAYTRLDPYHGWTCWDPDVCMAYSVHLITGERYWIW